MLSTHLRCVVGQRRLSCHGRNIDLGFCSFCCGIVRFPRGGLPWIADGTLYMMLTLLRTLNRFRWSPKWWLPKTCLHTHIDIACIMPLKNVKKTLSPLNCLPDDPLIGLYIAILGYMRVCFSRTRKTYPTRFRSWRVSRQRATTENKSCTRRTTIK